MQLVVNIICCVWLAGSPILQEKQAVPTKIYLTGAEAYKLVEMVNPSQPGSKFRTFSVTHHWTAEGHSGESLMFYFIDSVGSPLPAKISRKSYKSLPKTTIPQFARMLSTRYGNLLNHKNIFLVRKTGNLYELVPVRLVGMIADE